jgi:ribosomal protein S18 acetylase RimI-like enzyme
MAFGTVHEWREGAWTISTDPARVDVAMVHGFLVDSYWAKGIPRRIVEKSIAGSVSFGTYGPGANGEQQVGFARVITDLATFAYLADVFVLPEYRGRGLSKFLMRCIMAHPELQEVRTWLLATGDAHGLYRQFGFSGVVELNRHEAYMAKPNPGVYEKLQVTG